MMPFRKKVRIVRALVDTGVTEKDQVFEEYFDKVGYFYPQKTENPPNGIGLPFDVYEDSNWITSGKVEVLSEIPLNESRWWTVVEKQYRTMLREFKADKFKLEKEISKIESILNNPTQIYEQQSRGQEDAD